MRRCFIMADPATIRMVRETLLEKAEEYLAAANNQSLTVSEEVRINWRKNSTELRRIAGDLK